MMTIGGLASGTGVEEGDRRYPQKMISMAIFANQSDMIHKTPYRVFIRQAASARESTTGPSEPSAAPQPHLHVRKS